jgi:hypothetical protein
LFREIAVGLRGLDFRTPVAPCNIDRLLMIVLIGGHAALKRKEGRFPIRPLKNGGLQTAAPRCVFAFNQQAQAQG